MRLAVLDVGSSAANLVVADSASDTAHDGALPLTVHAWKRRTALAEKLGPDGTIAPEGVRRVVAAVAGAAAELERTDADHVFAFATAAIRDAPNRAEVLDAVTAATGLRLGLLSGVEEARLTFLAARRWVGWQAGPLLLVDIGGGTLEVASGPDRLPADAVSVPLGAGRLTRQFLRDGDPPPASAVRKLRRHVREQVRQLSEQAPWESSRTAVATSATLRQLARLAGAAPRRRGPFVDRHLSRHALRPWISRLATMPAEKRAGLPGISRNRARQALAGAIVANELMRVLNIGVMQVCPWGLREGILLRQLEIDQPALSRAAWVPRRGLRAVPQTAGADVPANLTGLRRRFPQRPGGEAHPLDGIAG